jgi:hypothetical protein
MTNLKVDENLDSSGSHRFRSSQSQSKRVRDTVRSQQTRKEEVGVIPTAKSSPVTISLLEHTENEN